MGYPDFEKKQNATDVVPGFITADDALSVTTQEDVDRARELQLKHNNQYRTAAALAIGAGDVAVKAEGAYWWDINGVKHLDFIGSVGPGLLGLNNPFVVEKVKKYLDAFKDGKSSLLSDITSGFHYHTVSADSTEILDLIQAELKAKGYLAKLMDYEPIDFWH